MAGPKYSGVPELVSDEATGLYLLPPALRPDLVPGGYVRRVAAFGACEYCVQRAGDYPGNQMDAYATHLWCQCTWQAIPAEEANMSTGATIHFSEAELAADGEGRSGWLVIEPDGTKHLPTKKNGAYDRGLCGDAWAALHKGFRGKQYAGPDKSKALSRLIAIYKSQGWDLPATASARSKFSISGLAATTGEWVTRRGLIFEAGSYPDKGLVVIPEDLAHAVAEFVPCALDLEHIDTPLDGKLGELVAIEQGADGWTLMGEVRLPKVIDDLLEGTGRRVSITWDKAKRLVIGLALVNEPRIADAALLAAFSQAGIRLGGPAIGVGDPRIPSTDDGLTGIDSHSHDHSHGNDGGHTHTHLHLHVDGGIHEHEHTHPHTAALGHGHGHFGGDHHHHHTHEHTMAHGHAHDTIIVRGFPLPTDAEDADDAGGEGGPGDMDDAGGLPGMAARGRGFAMDDQRHDTGAPAPGVHNTSHGQLAMQTLHDFSARCGAMCMTANPNGTQAYYRQGQPAGTTFTSGHERDGLQAIHDMAMGHGAKCSALGMSGAGDDAYDPQRVPPGSQNVTPHHEPDIDDMSGRRLGSGLAAILFAGSRHSRSDAADIQAIHDLSQKQGATCSSGDGSGGDMHRHGTGQPVAGLSSTTTTGRRRMNPFDNFREFFKMGRDKRELLRAHGGVLPDEALFTVVETEATEASREAKATEVAKLEAAHQAALAERDAIRRETARFRAEKNVAEATQYVDQLIHTGKLFPAERESLIADFTQRAADDATMGPIKFNDTDLGSRVDQLKARCDARPSHGLFTPTQDGTLPAQFKVLPGAQQTGNAEQEAAQRREKLLEFTPQGQALLSQRRQKTRQA